MDIFHYIGIVFSSEMVTVFTWLLMAFAGFDIPYVKKGDRYILISFIVGHLSIINDGTMANNMIRVGYRLRSFKGKYIGIKILKWQV